MVIADKAEGGDHSQEYDFVGSDYRLKNSASER
jgi:hypothetical protein